MPKQALLSNVSDLNLSPFYFSHGLKNRGINTGTKMTIIAKMSATRGWHLGDVANLNNISSTPSLYVFNDQIRISIFCALLACAH